MNKNQILFCIVLFMIIFYCAKPCLAGGKFQYSLSEKGVLKITGKGKLESVNFPREGIDFHEAKRVVIDEGITEIEGLYFFVFRNVEELTLPDSLKTIGNNAFCNNVSLKKVTFGKNIEKIGKDTFDNCRQLKTVILPDSVKKIGESAFSRCTRLEKLVIPASLKSWRKDITEQCPSLKTIVNRSKKTIQIDNCDGKRIWKVAGKKTTSIPKGKTAKSRGKQIPITYKLLGGKQTGNLPTSYEYGTIVRIPFHVKKKGYTMAAWNFRDQMEEDGGYFFTSIGPAATNVVLRPLWFKYSVTSPKKGCARVQVSGYETYQMFDYFEIRCSDRRDMSDAVEAYIIGGKVTKTFKGLKSGKRYYFEFRCAPDADYTLERSKWMGRRSIVVK